MIWICGLSMEMELAEAMGTVGKCQSCLYFDELNSGELFCKLYQEVLGESKVVDDEEKCPDWIVDHR